MTKLRISLLGGASAIGASSTLVEVGTTRLLIDCGVRFRADAPLPHLDGLGGMGVDAILVTHAHSDHTGGLPVAHRTSPWAPIYMTAPTVDLTRVLFRDALKIMGHEDKETELPLYSEEDVASLFERIRPVKWYEAFTVGCVEIRYLPASHILGASMIHLATPAGHVLFTGDFCVTSQRTVPALPLPKLPVDVIVTESTYGNRLHTDRRVTEEALIQKVSDALHGGGRVLIPSFALGRAQEILLILREAFDAGRLPPVPVFADGLVRAMCQVYRAHEDALNPALAKAERVRGHLFFDDRIQAVEGTAASRRDVLRAGPCVIVASSGMLTGGPSAFYARELAGNERDAILLSGYQDEESPGRALLGLLDPERRGDAFLPLPGGPVPLRCQIGAFSLSAHADKHQTLRLIEHVRPHTVVLVHGDPEAKASLTRGLGDFEVIHGEDGLLLERSYPRRILPSHARGRVRTGAVAAQSPLPEATPKERAFDRLARYCRSSHFPAPVAQVQAGKDGWAFATVGFEFVGREIAHTARGIDVSEARDAAALALFLQLRAEKAQALEKGRGPVLLTEALVTRLREENPKGRVLEWSHAARQDLPPVVVTSLGPELHAARGYLEAGNVGMETRVYLHRTVRGAEAGAYGEMLQALQAKEQSRKGRGARASNLPAVLVSVEGTSVKSSDPRMWLSEARHARLIERVELEHHGTEGKPPALRFLVSASAVLPDGRRVETEVHRASSKRRAEAFAAECLRDILLGHFPERGEKGSDAYCEP